MLLILLPTCPLNAQQTTPPDNPPKPADLEPVRTSITVSDRVATEAPASVSIMDRRDLLETPGLNIDDRLRQIPGFTLFRRSSSIVANPTTQGVSLRGIGSSGASRTLVFWDGIPMNDPFGGWVYWDRFAPDQIERVEISRGAATSLFGDRAMSGAIGIFSRESGPRRIRAGYEAGNRNTHDLSLGGSNLWRRFGLSGEVRAVSTDGYFIVPASIRGPIDTPAAVRFVAGNIGFELLGSSQRLFTRLDILAEDRANGTVLQRNSTSLGTLSANYSWQHAGDGITVLAYHTQEEFRASFSSIGAGRATERLTYNQVVPSNATGGAAYWSHNTAPYNFVLGADFERAEGYSTDRLVPSGERFGGGIRFQHGTFAQFNAGNSWARIFLGARYHFTGGDEKFFSPNGGFALGRGRFRFRGSGYRSFRAPTLNELYREFRVGNVITQPNADLRSESLTGGEIGLDYAGEKSHLTATLFRNSLDGIITNITLQTGATIIRQRQNAVAAVAKGFEATARRQLREFRGEASYLWVDSRYETGPQVPQVPKHQGSAGLSWEHRGTLASAGIRSFAYQFEDDLNKFILPGFATVQLVVRQQLTRGLSASIAIENLLDREYVTGFSPTPTIGAPLLWRAGLRWSQ